MAEFDRYIGELVTSLVAKKKIDVFDLLIEGEG